MAFNDVDLDDYNTDTQAAADMLPGWNKVRIIYFEERKNKTSEGEHLRIGYGSINGDGTYYTNYNYLNRSQKAQAYARKALCKLRDTLGLDQLTRSEAMKKGLEIRLVYADANELKIEDYRPIGVDDADSTTQDNNDSEETGKDALPF